jgi:hypothetical protein
MLTTVLNILTCTLVMVTGASVDVLAYFCFDFPLCYWLIAFLIAYYWYYDSAVIVTTGFFLAATESFAMHQEMIINVMALLIALFFIRITKYRVYLSPLYPILTFILVIGGILACRGTFPWATPAAFFGLSSYTIPFLFGNVGVITLLSLKFQGGHTRQSLIPLR